VDNKYFWEKVPDDNLAIEVTGITQDEMDAIVESNLHLQCGYERITTDFGEILSDEEQAGKIYVNGLFIKKFTDYDYGYNLKSQYVKLDRDRSMINTFDLEWLISRMWASKDIPANKVVEAVKNAPEAKYVASTTYYSSRSDIFNTAHQEFVKEHGEKAIPISSNEELQKYKGTKYETVLVSEQEKELITRSKDYEEPDLEEEETPLERLNSWYYSIRHKLEDSENEEFEYIYGKLE
jgi:hypothetical protein